MFGACTVQVDWPGGGQGGVYFTPSPLSAQGSTTPLWLGTLVANGGGTTGALYRRNRYYSTESGQVTQQDPIGLGGGVNLYGFAAGDPATYSDPFGLCPEGKVCPDELDAQRALVKINPEVTQFVLFTALFGMMENSSQMGVGSASSDEEAAATGAIRNQVMDQGKSEARPGFQLTKGAVSAEEFAVMARSFAGKGATLSKSGNALVGAGADATFVAKLPRYKTYGGSAGRLGGNLTVVNSKGQTVINAHIPIVLGPVP